MNLTKEDDPRHSGLAAAGARLLDMGLEVNVTWGDSWTRPKEGLNRVLEELVAKGPATRENWCEGDPALDIYVYVSGAVWQHERQGVQLGTLSDRGRDSLRVMIYVPDEITDEPEAVEYFRDTLFQVSDLVRARLLERRPAWPINDLVDEVLSLSP